MRKSIPAGAMEPPSPPSEERVKSDEYKKFVLGPKMLDEMLTRMAVNLQYLWVMAYKTWQVKCGLPPTYRSSPRWDGGVHPDTKRKHPCIWFEVAHYVLSHNLEPEALVNAQFAFRGLSGKPTPLDLKSPPGYARYMRYRNQIERTLRRRFESQKVAARLAVNTASTLFPGDNKTIYASVIADTALQMTPLFRYCLAVEQGLFESALYWKQLAMEQYLAEPRFYDEVWGSFIPEELQESVEALRNAIQMVNQKGIGNDRTISSYILPEEQVWLEEGIPFGAGTS